jgi:hypothetical protein
MTGQGLLHGVNFLSRHIPGLIAALMPALELVEGPMAGTAGLGQSLPRSMRVMELISWSISWRRC